MITNKVKGKCGAFYRAHEFGGPVGARGRLNFSFPYSTSWTKGFRPLEQKDATSLTLKTSPRWPTICRQVIFEAALGRDGLNGSR